jgi:hypothetical protein
MCSWNASTLIHPTVLTCIESGPFGSSPLCPKRWVPFCSDPMDQQTM